MKVYVWEEGEYSDRQVEGVFSTRENAERAIAARGNGEADDIGEWELDEMLAQEKGPIFRARIHCKTGEIVSTGRSSDGFRHPGRCKIEFRMNCDRNWAIIAESPVSAEHAVKVAVERRQRWLREGSPEIKVADEVVEVVQ